MGETIMDGWAMDKINEVDLEEEKLVEDKPDKDEFNVEKVGLGFKGDMACLVGEIERESVPSNKWGMPQFYVNIYVIGVHL